MQYLDLYQRQVGLLLRMLPFVAEETSFALKGGTAINLFVRDLPRLSVDIDLTYLPVSSRQQSLAAIDAAMTRLADQIRTGLPGAYITASRLHDTGTITKLFVDHDHIRVKVEITPVLRGCVYDPVPMSVSRNVEDNFGFAEMLVVSFADLYAGKIVAALDRQHPRDLFDVRDLLANEGISPELRAAFVVYLLSHNRPMAEVLAPTLKDISAEFTHSFEGMTSQPVSLDELLTARDRMIAHVVGDMPGDHREFLISFNRGAPDWDLLDLPNVRQLPAVKWRQLNLNKLSKKGREAEAEHLQRVWRNA